MILREFTKPLPDYLVSCKKSIEIIYSLAGNVVLDRFGAWWFKHMYKMAFPELENGLKGIVYKRVEPWLVYPHP